MKYHLITFFCTAAFLVSIPTAAGGGMKHLSKRGVELQIIKIDLEVLLAQYREVRTRIMEAEKQREISKISKQPPSVDGKDSQEETNFDLLLLRAHALQQRALELGERAEKIAAQMKAEETAEAKPATPK